MSLFRGPVTESALRHRLLLVVGVLGVFGACLVCLRDSDGFQVLTQLTPLVIAIPGAWFIHSLQLSAAYRRDRRHWMTEVAVLNESLRTLAGAKPQEISARALHDARRGAALLLVTTRGLGIGRSIESRLAQVRDALSAVIDNPLYSAGADFRDKVLVAAVNEELNVFRTAYHELMDEVEAQAFSAGER